MKNLDEIVLSHDGGDGAHHEAPEEFLRSIFDENQLEFFKKEAELSRLTLDDNGRIVLPEKQDPIESETIKQWKNKEGVLDAREIYGSLVIVYNTSEKVPEGAPDLRKANHAGRSRSGEYHPDTKICYVDLSNSWSFLDDKYIPAWIQQYVRHELRHHLVSAEDERYSTESGKQERRNMDWHSLKEREPEKATQLAYLDELHSQYFDALDGEIEGRNCFRTIDSTFYSIEGQGPHLEIAAHEASGKEAAKALFYYLQGLLLIRKMSASGDVAVKSQVESLTNAAGVVLGTERSMMAAAAKIKLIWEKLTSNSEMKKSFEKYIATYTPHVGDNTPEITSELKNVLNIL